MLGVLRAGGSLGEGATVVVHVHAGVALPGRYFGVGSWS